MLGDKRRVIVAAALTLAATILLFTGCRTSTSSGLPNHLRTVEVHIFQNKTMYKGVEAWVTREIIDSINRDAKIRVANRGDALITGEIISVDRRTLRETTTNEPDTMLIIIRAKFSFYDQLKDRYIVEDATVVSNGTGMSGGIYESSRGGNSEEGQIRASKQLAGEIVRRTVGMW